MLCLELLTGDRPFREIDKDDAVVTQLISGRLPQRPGPPADARGLDDRLWGLMMACWNARPEKRPTMANLGGMIKHPQPAPSIGSYSIISRKLSH